MPADPLAEVETLLERAAGEAVDTAGGTLREVLAILDRAREGVAIEPPRALAYRAEALRRLGRLREAATAYAAALETSIDDAGTVWGGLLELSETLRGHEEVLRISALARAKHPGRSWQWDAIAERAEESLRLEATAPVAPPDLATLRAEVARRLAAAPCRHDDDRRLVTGAAARDLGHDPEAVLAWLSALGACCCD